MSKLAGIGFQYPGWEMAWWTIMIILMTPLAPWLIARAGQVEWHIAVLIVCFFPAVGVWFRVRSAGHFFLVAHTLVGILLVVGLILLPFGWQHLFKIAVAFSTAHAALQWTRRILIENELAERGMSAEAINEATKMREILC